MDIKQLKAAVQLAKLRVGSDPSDANKAKLENAQNEYDNALNPTVDTAEKKTDDEVNPDKQPQPSKPASTKPAAPKAAPAKPKTEPLENHPLKTTRTVVPISPKDPTEPQTPEPQPDAQPEPTEAK